MTARRDRDGRTRGVRCGRILLLTATLVPFGTTCLWPKTYTIVERVQLADLREETAALEATTCVPERVGLDPTTSSPRPPQEGADANFEGDIYGLRVHVTHREDGTYDYLETWSAGPWPFWELVPIGSDWKTGCRIHSCGLPDGRRCCWQECTDGGARGLAYEGPDRFTCMNITTGAIFQWFLDGLAESGVSGLEGCEAPAEFP